MAITFTVSNSSFCSRSLHMLENAVLFILLYYLVLPGAVVLSYQEIVYVLKNIPEHAQSLVPYMNYFPKTVKVIAVTHL